MRAADSIPILIAVLFGGCAAPQRPAHPPALYRSQVTNTATGGKPLVMTFQEVRRSERTSTVYVKFKSGASVPSIMFIVRGFYDLAKSRNARYFIKLKEWGDIDGDWKYLVGFSQSKNVDPQKHFGLREPLPKDEEHAFMAVKDCDWIFAEGS
jgi:hypothetical protein